MLTVNADDFGHSLMTTDRTMTCFAANRVNAASAMVFMEDSERAAALAIASGLDVGLHINFTEVFTAPYVPPWLRRNHERLRRFLGANKYALVIYNPFLRKAFREVLAAQIGEFARLYGRTPSRFDGHQHMHLCSNMLLDGLLPAGARVRRNFSFAHGEKGVLNRLYRKVVDSRLARRHRLGHYFFGLSQQRTIPQLRRIVALAKSWDVELLVHPHVNDELEMLLSDEFAKIISMADREVFIASRVGSRHDAVSWSSGFGF